MASIDYGEYRVTFTRMPTNYNPKMVRYCKASSPADAIEVIANRVERELGIAWSEYAYAEARKVD